MNNKFNIDDIVTYTGSDDDWNHECCKGAEYKVTHVYPPVWGMYYYNLESTTKNHDIITHDHYREMHSVREYQLK